MKVPEFERRDIDCEQALRMLADYLDHEIEVVRGAEVERHLERCRSCFSRAEFEKGLRARLQELRQETVDPAFEARIGELARSFVNR